jgi:hypothetical protein
MKKALYAILFTTVAMAGCASMRGVEVGSGDPTRTYAIEVTNIRAGIVTISYSTGAAPIELGTVSPQRTERFVIALNEPGQITVVAKTSSGASAGNYPVTLEAGVTRRITVR